jgi:hypothetical protein
VSAGDSWSAIGARTAARMRLLSVEREVNLDPRDRLWWRSPWLLGGVAIAMVVVLNIIFI